MRSLKISHIIIPFLSIAIYVILGYSGDYKSQIELYLILITVVFIAYGYLVYLVLNNRISGRKIVIWYYAGAIVLRLLLIPSEPVLSNDVYRYLWDGRVNASGINPYQFTPASPELKSLRDEAVYQKLNFPDIATVYPPLSQFYFLINDWLGGSLVTWKLLLFMMEFLTCIIILRLLSWFSIENTRIFIFIFNPLLIIETYQNAHLEIVGILFFWLAVLEFYRKRDWRSVIFFSLSVLTKFLPIFSGIIFFWNKPVRKALLSLAIIILFLLPFSTGGVLPLPGLFSYVNRWEFNGALFQTVVSFFKYVQIHEYKWMTANLSGHEETFYIGAGYYYKLLAFIFFLVLVYDQIKKLKSTAKFRTISFIQVSFVLTAAILLLTPTLYPWYLIWILPFLVFIPNLSWILFFFLIQFSYFVLKQYSLTGIWEESLWILLIEYVPFYLLLILEYGQKQKIKGWLIN
jgi:hypothetical protein